MTTMGKTPGFNRVEARNMGGGATGVQEFNNKTFTTAVSKTDDKVDDRGDSKLKYAIL